MSSVVGWADPAFIIGGDDSFAEEGLPPNTHESISLPRAYLWSTFAIAALVLFSSVMGIFVAGTYARETTNWAGQARAQDMADLVAVGVLLVAACFAFRGSLRGLLVWIGGLLFLIYAFVIYSFDAHFNSLFFVYVAVLGLSVYSFLGGALRSDFERLRAHFPSNGRARTVISVFLILIAAVFLLLWLSEDIPALLAGSVPPSITEAGLLTNPVHVLDFSLYLPAIIITGVSLWRRGALGYIFAAPMLVFSALTGIGILFMSFQTGASSVSASIGQEAFVSVLAFVSVILCWFHLRDAGKASAMI